MAESLSGQDKVNTLCITFWLAIEQDAWDFPLWSRKKKSFLFGHIIASLRKHPFLLSLRRDVFAGYIIACVASVSVRFRSKRETFFARSLTLAPRSSLLNRTETLATQARHIINPLFPSLFGENRLKDSGLFSFLRFYWPWLLLGPIKT